MTDAEAPASSPFRSRSLLSVVLAVELVPIALSVEGTWLTIDGS